MALSDEQRAMLQLLLEGGQGYEDIGSLLGTSPDEVRSRAREALTEMGGADPDAQVGLTDYLLGQADPIGRADAVRQLQNDPEANALADRLLAQLRLLAPKAELPEIPAARGGRRAAPAPPPPPAAETAAPASPGPAPPKGPGFASRVSSFFSNLGGGGKRRSQLIAAGVAGLALVIAVVVIAAGSGGDGEQSAEDCPTVDTSQAQQAGLPVIALEAPDPPEGECAPSGQVTFISSKKQLGLQLDAVGLPPTSSDNVYTAWLYRSDEESFPLSQAPSTDGNLKLSIPLPAQLGAIIAAGAFQSVRLALLTRSDAQDLVTKAQQQSQQTGVLPFAGTTVLEGALPQPQQAQQPQGGGGQAPQGQAPQGAQGGGTGSQ